MVFQHFNLFPHMTALENVTVGPIRVKGEDKPAAVDHAKQLLGRVGLAEKFDAYPRQLSGGQQQRVAIAQGPLHAAKAHAVRRAHLSARPGTGQ